MMDTTSGLQYVPSVETIGNRRSAEPILVAHDVTVSYGSTPALRAVTLSIEPGEVCAVAGPSGSGKSTLLHCLAGLLRPDSGSVMFAGVDIGRADEADRADMRLHRFGFVFQFGHLIPELTALDNVALPVRLAGVARREARVAARTMLTSLDLGEYADRHPADLSGGQYQRVAVARALVGQPEVIFADEPTGALDSASAHLVLGEITGLARTLGSAVVLVSHDPGVVDVADRVVRLRDGRIEP